jgi:thiamine monophosphate synthase
VLRAGAQRVAVCADVTEAPNPGDACRRFKDKIAEVYAE